MAISAYPVAPVKKTFRYGNQNVTLETGHMARQATGAVIVSIDETVVMVTVVAKKEAKAEAARGEAKTHEARQKAAE